MTDETTIVDTPMPSSEPVKEKKPRKKRKTVVDKPKRPPNQWLIHYAEWRKNNQKFIADNHDVTAWVKEAKKTYKAVKKGKNCAKCGHYNE